MNLEQLSTLVAIVEHGGFSAAARSLQVTQPAVSKQIQRLEVECGLELLKRGVPGKVRLTPAGERLLAFARSTLSQWEALTSDLAALQPVAATTLRVAASTIPGEYVLPPLLAAFRAEYPEVRVQMTVANTADVVRGILAEEADVGAIGSAMQREGLRLEHLASDEIVLIVPRAHRFAGRVTIQLAELRGEPLVVREEGSGTRRSIEAALAASGIRLPESQVVLTLGSTHAILRAVESGLGVGFVSAQAAGAAVSDGRVGCVRLSGVDTRRQLYVAYLARRAGDPLLAHFLGFVRARRGA